MSQDLFAQFPPEEPEDELFDEMGDSFSPPFDADLSAPSLPIILVSAASGIALAVIALYLSFQLLGLTIQFSAAIATLAMSVGLGLTGAMLSTVTGSRAAMANIFLSCGLVIAAILFFGFCTLVGAFAATFILTLR